MIIKIFCVIKSLQRERMQAHGRYVSVSCIWKQYINLRNNVNSYEATTKAENKKAEAACSNRWTGVKIS